MGKLRYVVATSLDGFIAPSNESADWIVDDPSIDFAAIYAEFDGFIMGRKTYDFMLSEGDKNPLKSRSKDQVAVLSSTLNPAVHDDITLLRTVEEAVEWTKAAKASCSKDVWLFGGGQLSKILLDAKLADTMEVAIMPVILGSGIKMVHSEGDKPGCSLSLRECRHLDSGIVICIYDVSYPDEVGV